MECPYGCGNYLKPFFEESDKHPECNWHFWCMDCNILICHKDRR